MGEADTMPVKPVKPVSSRSALVIEQYIMNKVVCLVCCSKEESRELVVDGDNLNNANMSERELSCAVRRLPCAQQHELKARPEIPN